MFTTADVVADVPRRFTGLDDEGSPHWFQFAGPLHLEQHTEDSPPLDLSGQKTLRVKRHAQLQTTKVGLCVS